jgi:hypothetical protein
VRLEFFDTGFLGQLLKWAWNWLTEILWDNCYWSGTGICVGQLLLEVRMEFFLLRICGPTVNKVGMKLAY